MASNRNPRSRSPASSRAGSSTSAPAADGAPSHPPADPRSALAEQLGLRIVDHSAPHPSLAGIIAQEQQASKARHAEQEARAAARQQRDELAAAHLAACLELRALRERPGDDYVCDAACFIQFAVALKSNGLLDVIPELLAACCVDTADGRAAAFVLVLVLEAGKPAPSIGVIEGLLCDAREHLRALPLESAAADIPDWLAGRIERRAADERARQEAASREAEEQTPTISQADRDRLMMALAGKRVTLRNLWILAQHENGKRESELIEATRKQFGKKISRPAYHWALRDARQVRDAHPAFSSLTAGDFYALASSLVTQSRRKP